MFKVLKKEIGNAKSVRIVGEFNNWDKGSPVMRKLKSGDFSYIINLDKDKAYQFRYLIDDTHWMNDNDADAYLPSPFPGVDNSVIAL